MKIKDGFVLRTLATEHIVTADGPSQVDFNKLISLNPAATYLWQRIGDQEFDHHTLAGLLSEKYDVDLVTAERDAKSFIARMESAGLVE